MSLASPLAIPEPVWTSEYDLINGMGYPQAGKGTQLGRVKQHMANKGKKVMEIGTGNALRTERDRGTALGKQAAEYMDAGNLVPTQLVNQALFNLVRDYHDRLTTRQAVWAFDGYPRTEEQIDDYENIVSNLGRRDVVLMFSLGTHERAKEIILERAKIRVVQAIAKGEKPRKDDLEPETLINRYKIAVNTLDPVVDYMRRTRKVIDINADADVDDVTREVLAKLAEIGIL